MEDQRIIQLFRERSETAVTEAASRYGTYCQAIACRILQNDEDAKECVNEAYYRVWNAIPPADPPCLRTYLGKITRHVALNMLKKREAQRRGGELSRLLCKLSACVPVVDTTVSDAEHHLLKEVINRFLYTLNERDRWVFVQRYWFMRPMVTIASALHISEGAVKTILHRLRKKLKQELKKEGFDVE